MTTPLIDLRAEKRRLSVPVIAAPMLLVSGPELVSATCSAGVMGSLPSLNARTSDEFDGWLTTMETALAGTDAAPFAINLIVREADRFAADLAVIEAHRVPIVITSVGHPGAVADRVHAYGGVVLHDVATIRHAEKAIAAGVDGLILLTAGAGGHTGHANPFAFVRDVRSFWKGIVAVAGGISDGHGVRAAEALGADFAYMGTRFAATAESRAHPDYKQLLIDQTMADVLTTDRISGLPASFLRGSISRAGLNPDGLPPIKAKFQPDLPDGIRAWRDIWSGGHGTGLIRDAPPVAELVRRLAADYAGDPQI